MLAGFGALPDAAGKALHANRVRAVEERGRCPVRDGENRRWCPLPASPIDLHSLHDDFKGILAKTGMPDLRFHESPGGVLNAGSGHPAPLDSGNPRARLHRPDRQPLHMSASSSIAQRLTISTSGTEGSFKLRYLASCPSTTRPKEFST